MKRLLVVLALVLAACGDDGPTAAEEAEHAARVERLLATNVLYEVEGTATFADITYETPTGTQQASPDVPLAMATGSRAGEQGLMVGPFQRGDFVYISAQNKKDSGTISCRISTEDGRVISENSSSGGYSIATCKGKA